MKNVNSEQRALVTVIERIDVLEERVVLLELDNEELRQRLDQAQEASYLLECEIQDNHKRIVEMKYNQACERYRKPVLGGRYRTWNEYLASFGNDVERMDRACRNWDALKNKIMES